MNLINILIRTSNRPTLFKRCLDSILSQSYSNVRIIVSVDQEVNYVPQWIETIEVQKHPELKYGYDLYLNDLKALVNEGWYFFLDDDDVLAPNVLSEITLDSPAILCQINHLGTVLPRSTDFGIGLVGFPCLIMHHSLKRLAMVSGGDHNDYHYIKEVQSKVELKFQPVVLVICDVKGNGK
jgi:glycosyltransferase involved in cell wall biosynthesis